MGSEFVQCKCAIAYPGIQEALGRFFLRLVKSNSELTFHPHPLTAGEAKRISSHRGRDRYYVLLGSDDEVYGYGFLRGLDAGFEVPSLGIAIDESIRGFGYGRKLMNYIHSTATQMGVRRIRLKVYRDNFNAISLYTSLGYQLNGLNDRELVGMLDLAESNPEQTSD